MKLTVRKLCVLAILSALSVVVALTVRFPIFQAAPFLEFDAGDAIIMAGTFLYGPVAGVAMTLITSLVQGFTVSAGSGFWGVLMHFVSTSCFVIVSGVYYRRHKEKKFSATVALLIGVLCAVLLMIPLNLLITPIYTGAPREAVLEMMLPIILPFNLIKFSGNALLSYLLWWPVYEVYQRTWGKRDVK